MRFIQTGLGLCMAWIQRQTQWLLLEYLSNELRTRRRRQVPFFGFTHMMWLRFRCLDVMSHFQIHHKVLSYRCVCEVFLLHLQVPIYARFTKGNLKMDKMTRLLFLCQSTSIYWIAACKKNHVSYITTSRLYVFERYFVYVHAPQGSLVLRANETTKRSSQNSIFNPGLLQHLFHLWRCPPLQMNSRFQVAK